MGTFNDTKVAITGRKSKDRKCNGQEKNNNINKYKINTKKNKQKRKRIKMQKKTKGPTI